MTTAITGTLPDLRGYSPTLLFLQAEGSTSFVNADGHATTITNGVVSATVSETLSGTEYLAELRDAAGQLWTGWLSLRGSSWVLQSERPVIAGGGDATLAKQEEILAAIDAYLTSITAAAADEPGTLVGFPSTLKIGDSYTADTNNSINISLVDGNDDPITEWGDYNVNTAGFTPSLVITQSGQTGMVKATVTYDTDHFVVEIPSSESRRAAPGVATMQFKLQWITAGKVVAQRTIVSAQAVTWSEML